MGQPGEPLRPLLSAERILTYLVATIISRERWMARGVNSKPAKQAYFGVSERGLLRHNEEDVLLISVIWYRNIFSE